MRVQLAKTTGWYSESGQSTWGFGIEVHNFASQHEKNENEVELRPEGWQVSLQFGPWMLSIYSEAGFEGIYGLSTQYYGTFSVERP